MAQKLIDIYEHMLKYNDKIVYIAFHSKTIQPYFHAKQLCELLEYVNYHQALRDNIDNIDIFYLKDIVKNYKTLYKNVQGHTKFISEAGLYSLIFRSRNKKAKEITDWITHEVMPSLRKYGEYKLNHTLKKQIDELNNEISVLKHNLKKPKYSKGGMVYLLRTIDNAIIFDPNQIIYMKFGRTSNMNKRKLVYDTATKNKVQILKAISVNDPKTIEQCVITKMNEYKIQHKKEYFECSYNIIINEIAECIKFYEQTDIDKTPDISSHEINRQNNTDFDPNKVSIIRIISDEDFDKMFTVKSDNDSDSESDTESNSDDSDDISIDNQKGGSYNKYSYIKYKMKYLELKYDLL